MRPEPPAAARPRPQPRVRTARVERPLAPEPPRAPSRPEAPRPPGGQLDCGSDAACLSQLRALIDDPERRWIGSPLPSAEYARGVRLFAYRVLRARLTCSELVIALAEIEAARKPLAGPVAGITPAQAARARMLSDEVEAELRSRAGERAATRDGALGDCAARIPLPPYGERRGSAGPERRNSPIAGKGVRSELSPLSSAPAYWGIPSHEGSRSRGVFYGRMGCRPPAGHAPRRTGAPHHSLAAMPGRA